MMCILWKMSVIHQLHISNDVNVCHRDILVYPLYYMILLPRKKIFFMNRKFGVEH